MTAGSWPHEAVVDAGGTGGDVARPRTPPDVLAGLDHADDGVGTLPPPGVPARLPERIEDGPPVPPDVAARIVRAVDRSPSTVVTLVNPDLSIEWVSHSATWVTGTDPAGRRGANSLERIHPDDVDQLIRGLAQLRDANDADSYLAGMPQPIRYRFLRFDGRWVVMEATIHNVLDDPEAGGMLVFSRPVSGEIDGVGYVIDLLVAGMPLPEILAACAALVPEPLGAAAVVALLPDGPVVGAPAGSPAEHLVRDDRWWRGAARGENVTPSRFAGFPPDAADLAREHGFRSAWALPIREQAAGEVIGCIVLWPRVDVEPNIGVDEALRHTRRLASLVIAEERRSHELRVRAVTDPLTGLGNRSALEMRLHGAEGDVTVAILDLDAFKPVNDTYGHDTGDEVLRVVAERLRGGVRDGDLAVRYGGDEFAIVFAPGTDPGDAGRSAERVARLIAEPIGLRGARRVTVGASLGVATAPAGEVTHLADSALYDAKRSRWSAPAPPAGDA
jgi:diguanylate cyclase (GGDEF)-like protein